MSADIHAPKILGAGIIDAAIPGVATTRGVTAVSVSATLTVTDNGALKIDVDDKGVGIDLRSLKIPNLDVDLSGPLNPVIDQSKVAASLAIRNLPFAQQQLQQIIDNQQTNLTFGDRIRESLAKLGRPISAGKNFYVDICPTSLSISNPQGVQENGQSMLVLPVEIKTPVRLIASSARPNPFPGPMAENLPITASNRTANLFDVQLVVDTPWKDLAESVDNAIKNFWNEQPSLAGLFTPGPVTMWETTGNKVAFAIPILKKNQQKTWVTLYGSGNSCQILENPTNFSSISHYNFARLE